MRQLWNRLLEIEPARAFAAIRAIAYIAVGATGAWLSPEHVEPILMVVGLLLGVDVATTEGTRNRVSPTSKGGPQP